LRIVTILFILLGYHAEEKLTIDTYEFIPPNWRMSFAMTFLNFKEQQCKIIGTIQEKVNGQYYDGIYGKRVPSIFADGNRLEVQAPVNGMYNKPLVFINIQLNQVRILYTFYNTSTKNVCFISKCCDIYFLHKLL